MRIGDPTAGGAGAARRSRRPSDVRAAATLQNVATGLKLLRRLPPILRRRIDRDAAVAIVEQRLASRAADFLTLLRDAVYPVERQPLRWLLTRAGVTHGDVARMVEREGLEGALAELFRAGVYLTADELAGRVPLVRGSDRLELLRMEDLRNPRGRGHLAARSGGSSSGTQAAFALDLDALVEQFPAYRLAGDAAGCADWPNASWIAPGSTGLATAVRAVVAFARPLERWFSPIDVRDPSMPSTFRWTNEAVRVVGALCGARLPAPEHVDPDDPMPIVRWIAAVKQRGEIPVLHLYPTSAVRLCEAASAAGVDVSGTRLSLRGEPITVARAAAVTGVGAVPLSLFGTIEAGLVGHGCLQPETVDEVHLHEDLHAIVQPGRDAPSAGLPGDALLLTTLRRDARLILINASLGDEAKLTRRACGCALETAGLRTHLAEIRSFQKLTGMGMTFAAAEVTPILEQILPARFGGVATDYQLIEEETGGGGVLLRLVVHPRLGPLDPASVAESFLQALGEVSPARRMMSAVWRQGGMVRVERTPPVAAPSGKLMHFRAAPRASGGAAR